MTTQIWAVEISVEIDGVEIWSAGELVDHNVVSKMVCLTLGDHSLVMKDTYGDGWHGGFVTIDGVDYGADFLGGSELGATITITEPSPSPPPSSPPSPLPSPPPASPPPAPCTPVTVAVTTIIWANEISVEIDGNEIWAAGDLVNDETKSTAVCLSPGQHTLLLKDTYGDGWHGGFVTIEGVNYGADFLQGGEMTYSFTVTDQGTSGGATPPPPPPCFNVASTGETCEQVHHEMITTFEACAAAIEYNNAHIGKNVVTQVTTVARPDMPSGCFTSFFNDQLGFGPGFFNTDRNALATTGTQRLHCNPKPKALTKKVASMAANGALQPEALPAHTHAIHTTAWKVAEAKKTKQDEAKAKKYAYYKRLHTKLEALAKVAPNKTAPKATPKAARK